MVGEAPHPPHHITRHLIALVHNLPAHSEPSIQLFDTVFWTRRDVLALHGAAASALRAFGIAGSIGSFLVSRYSV